MSSGERRRREIYDLITKKTEISVNELAQAFGVSVVTARRDIDILEHLGKVTRVHGGAMLPDDWEIRTEEFKESQMSLEKLAIANICCKMIRPNTSVFLDTGSTSLSLARSLKQRSDLALTVCTNDIQIAYELMGNRSFTVFSSGGKLLSDTCSFAGHFAENMIKSFRADIAFIGCDSVSLKFGAMTSSHELVSIKQAMIAHSRRAVLVCDSSKFERMSIAKIADLSSFERIVTDSKIPKDIHEKIEESGITCIKAS
jgi:DeoR/GlpR family transcriptional regulator of sugar metabolism